MKGTVKRLSEDFDWLNNTLLRLYPFLLVHSYSILATWTWSCEKGHKRSLHKKEERYIRVLTTFEWKKVFMQFICFYWLFNIELIKNVKIQEILWFNGICQRSFPDEKLVWQNWIRFIKQNQRHLSAFIKIIHPKNCTNTWYISSSHKQNDIKLSNCNNRYLHCSWSICITSWFIWRNVHKISNIQSTFAFKLEIIIQWYFDQSE